MTISVVAHNFAQQAGAASLVSVTFAPLSTELVFGFVLHSATISNIKDNASPNNTYNLVDSAGPTINGDICQSFYLNNVPGSPTTLTCNFTASTSRMSIFYTRISGQAASAPLDQHGTNTGTTGDPVGPSVTPLQNNELVAAACFEDAGAGISAGTGFTLLDQDTLENGGDEYQIQTTATAVSPGFTIGVSNAWTVAVMTFKPAGAAGTCPLTRTTLGVGCGVWAAKKIEENPILTRRSLIRPRRRLVREL